MDDLSRMMDADGDMEDEAAMIMMDTGKGAGVASAAIRSPLSKTRSLSDGGGTPKLTPSPHIFEVSQRQTKDDIGIRDKESESSLLPSTPVRAKFPLRGLALQLPPRDSTSPAQSKPAPLSPKLDHSQTYASPTNILPRRSRGLDFSRAATSLHHSTLADQASPDSSPTIGSRAMNIPGRRNGDYGIAEQSSNSLWSIIGNQDRMLISSSLGSNAHIGSDSSSSSEPDDFMDEDMDEAYVTTPHASRNIALHGAPWMAAGGSPAVNSLLSFQQRQRQRKQNKKKLRGPLGFASFASPANPNVMSKSPPSNMGGQKDMSPHARRESISWAANQLHISGNESDDNVNKGFDSPGVVRRPVTRRGNLLPKTKGFARIRAALAEESAPVETEFRREAEVVRQVRESDMDLEPRMLTSHSAATTALSSPNLAAQDSLDDVSEDIMMMDPTMGSGLGMTAGGGGTFKQQVMRNSKGKGFWDTFSDGGSSSMSAPRITPPPPPFALLARGSSAGLSLDDISMDSPSASSTGASQNAFILASGGVQTTTSSSSNGTPQPVSYALSNGNGSGSGSGGATGIPTAAEITRRINSKRRRDDDFDPVSFKRRAVSPGMSVHNSPIMQSPLQRDMVPWGSGSRPGSVGGDTTASAGKPAGGGGGSGAPSENGSGSGGGNGNSNRLSLSLGGGKGRVGFQGMVDTNDGITRLSIE
ncbi:hypothetical protein B0T26DRAFT_860243 [Lasiosphaeria miniovina]|uniref:Uncharacterized protein n=1 Tax=Lasiosphaeria miniovina TaxID=1954250 RepID=A0AA40A578_9PEZI|nr:uncharacterized protein B0T26DRAFT_860243 [Lasiosphaeria miniovina]KAK0709482.1 hypothetical protein B0T26DRAFT_860243 [Lasiosphaeria miniovina]